VGAIYGAMESGAARKTPTRSLSPFRPEHAAAPPRAVEVHGFLPDLRPLLSPGHGGAGYRTIYSSREGIVHRHEGIEEDEERHLQRGYGYLSGPATPLSARLSAVSLLTASSGNRLSPAAALAATTGRAPPSGASPATATVPLFGGSCAASLPALCCGRDGSLRASVFNLCSATLGAGALSLPYAFSRCGLALGLGLLLLVAAATVFSINLLLESRIASGFRSYEDLTVGLFGKRLAVLVEVR
jgi:hypothetical protein